MGLSRRAGGFLTADDSRRSERVCVVDEDFARYYWPHASAIGQGLWDGSEAGKDAEAFTIVGVVGGVKQAGLTESEAQGAIYYPYAFRIGDSVFVAVRTSLPPESFALTLQKVVRTATKTLSPMRSEEHTSELQSPDHLVCRLLLENKKHTTELQSPDHLVCRLLLEKKKHTSERQSREHRVSSYLVGNTRSIN